MKPNTQELVYAMILDVFPPMATCVDFGIDRNEQVFGAIQWAWRNDEVTEYELDEKLGNGPALTEIVHRGHNPYACTITTAWDDMPEDDDEY